MKIKIIAIVGVPVRMITSGGPSAPWVFQKSFEFDITRSDLSYLIVDRSLKLNGMCLLKIPTTNEGHPWDGMVEMRGEQLVLRMRGHLDNSTEAVQKMLEDNWTVVITKAENLSYDFAIPVTPVKKPKLLF